MLSDFDTSSELHPTFSDLLLYLTFPLSWNSACPQAGDFGNRLLRSLISSQEENDDGMLDQETHSCKIDEAPCRTILESRNYRGLTTCSVSKGKPEMSESA